VLSFKKLFFFDNDHRKDLARWSNAVCEAQWPLSMDPFSALNVIVRIGINLPHCSFFLMIRLSIKIDQQILTVLLQYNTLAL
jgi:hypothetical protein